MKKENKYSPQLFLSEQIKFFLTEFTVKAVMRHLKGLLSLKNLFGKCPPDKHYKRCVVYDKTVMCDNCGETRRFEIDPDELDST